MSDRRGQLLIGYLEGALDDADREMVERWLEQDPDYAAEYRELAETSDYLSDLSARAWRETGLERIVLHRPTQRQLDQTAEEREQTTARAAGRTASVLNVAEPRTLFGRIRHAAAGWGSAVAALFLFAALTSYHYVQNSSAHRQGHTAQSAAIVVESDDRTLPAQGWYRAGDQVAVHEGRRVVLKMASGTEQIVIEGGTTLKMVDRHEISQRGNNRAFYTVTDAASPFIVNTQSGGRVVVDIGGNAQFEVTPNRLRVRSGKVNYFPYGVRSPLAISGGQAYPLTGLRGEEAREPVNPTDVGTWTGLFQGPVPSSQGAGANSDTTADDKDTQGAVVPQTPDEKVLAFSHRLPAGTTSWFVVRDAGALFDLGRSYITPNLAPGSPPGETAGTQTELKFTSPAVAGFSRSSGLFLLLGEAEDAAKAIPAALGSALQPDSDFTGVYRLGINLPWRPAEDRQTMLYLRINGDRFSLSNIRRREWLPDRGDFTTTPFFARAEAARPREAGVYCAASLADAIANVTQLSPRSRGVLDTFGMGNLQMLTLTADLETDGLRLHSRLSVDGEGKVSQILGPPSDHALLAVMPDQCRYALSTRLVSSGVLYDIWKELLLAEGYDNRGEALQDRLDALDQVFGYPVRELVEDQVSNEVAVALIPRGSAAMEWLAAFRCKDPVLLGDLLESACSRAGFTPRLRRSPSGEYKSIDIWGDGSPVNHTPGEGHTAICWSFRRDILVITNGDRSMGYALSAGNAPAEQSSPIPRGLSPEAEGVESPLLLVANLGRGSQRGGGRLDESTRAVVSMRPEPGGGYDLAGTLLLDQRERLALARLLGERRQQDRDRLARFHSLEQTLDNLQELIEEEVRRTGAPPATMGMLVTKLGYLLDDPYAREPGTPLHYEVGPGRRWRLWSVGPDGIDEGGMRQFRHEDGFDSRGDVVRESPAG